MSAARSERVLVTGVTGYVGGRLVPRLLEEGYRVRVLVRDQSRLQGHPWIERVEVAEGDVLQLETLFAAMRGVDTAYYLVHSMQGIGDFRKRDAAAAGFFGAAASEAGVKRIVYLGGLGDPESDLSRHLRSRQETGQILRQSGVPVTEFRAAIVVGSGSVSFEIIRHLTERLPVMIGPRWLFTRVQPIAVRDLLSYLVECLRVPQSYDRVIEIGGADVTTYAGMMLEYARLRGLRRFVLPVPVLNPRLSSYWVHLVTPIPWTIARPLVEGLRNETVVRDLTARDLFPDIKPLTYETALKLALERLETGQVETAWSGALATSMGDVAPVIFSSEEGIVFEQRRRLVKAPPRDLYRVYSGLGGRRGWLFANWTWYVRGVVDRLFGGIGLRRGRRHPDDVRVGEALDFWRVEAAEPDRLLRLRAEMKVPGRAWLQFESAPDGDGKSWLTQTAYFVPKGLSGLAYWYALYPIHAIIFSGMVEAIARRAEESSSGARAAETSSATRP